MDKKKKIYIAFQFCTTVLAIIVGVIAISYLNNDRIFEFTIRDRLLEFTYRDAPTDNYIHGNAFSSLLINTEDAMEGAAIDVLYMAIGVLVISLIVSKFSDDIGHIFYMTGIGTMTLAGICYLLGIVIIGNGMVVDTTFWKVSLDGTVALIIYILLLVLGIVITAFGIVSHRKRELTTFKKVITIGIMTILAVATMVMMIIPLPKLSEKYKLANVYRDYVDAYRNGVNKEIAYQIGNYYMGIEDHDAGDGVYVDGKLYLTELREDDNENAIYTLDGEGNYEVFFESEDSLTNIDNLYYYDGYIYARCNVQGKETHTLIRISMADSSYEIVLSTEGRLSFGISEDKLYYGVYYSDTNREEDKKIYYIDLTGDISTSNALLYDDGAYTGERWFLHKYILNEDNAIPDAVFAPYWYQIYDGVMYGLERSDHAEYMPLEHNLYMYIYDEDERDYNKDTLIDEQVDRYNIFDGKIYYIKNLDKSLDSYEVWFCDIDGSNKTLIGILDPDEGDDREKHCCNTMLVGDGYIVFDFGQYYDYSYERYVINIEDGSSERLYE